MENMLKVSVIVPVYNTEKYLGECLDSIVNQTLGDIEIIIINDGSTDSSQAIIDKYQKQYPLMIKAYQQENKGLSATRNIALQHACGKYVAYIDADDYMREGIELLWKDYSGYPEYPQRYESFNHQVSILDLLFNTGDDAPYYIWGWREK